MIIKLTSCKYYTGGGDRKHAVPRRVRNHQSRITYVPDSIASWSDEQIRLYAERIDGYRYITMSDCKVVRHFNSREFYARLYANRTKRKLAKLSQQQTV